MAIDPPVPLSQRTRVSAWKVLGSLVAILAVLAGATVLWIRSVADRRWAAMERETRALFEEAMTRDSSRPVLRGKSIPGNAWDDYAGGMKLKGTSAVLDEYLSRGPKANPAAVEAMLAANPAALDSVRRGARRTHGQYRYDWERGFGGPWPPLTRCRVLTNLAVCQARLHAESGRAREAMELLLDAAQFARDVCHNATPTSEITALANYGLVSGEIYDLIRSGKLFAEGLTQLEQELEVADRSFPKSGHTLMNEAMLTGFTILRSERQSGYPGFAVDRSEVAASSWRFGFSTRLMEVDAFGRTHLAMRRLREADDKPWLEVKAQVEKVSKEAESSRNPLTRYLPGMARFQRHGREKRAQLRLLRVAARYRATGEVLDLDDPFGKKLLTGTSEQTLRIWSVGPDGVDDGGSGDFRGTANPPRTDLVLEVER